MTKLDVRDAAVVAIVILFLGLMCLWRIAEHLKAIRSLLADIADATRRDTGVELGRINRTASDTNRLLKLAITKQWGSAIDLGDER
jgi:hypothetical protein